MIANVTRRSRLLRAMAAAEQIHGFERGAIRSDRRGQAELVKVRQIVMLFAFEHLGMGYSEAGRAMRRDHSTVMWGVRKARERVGQHPWAGVYQALVQADAAGWCPEMQPSPQPPPAVADESQPAEVALAAPAALAGGVHDDGEVWSGRKWWDDNNARFVAAMRAAHSDREVLLEVQP